MFIMCVRSIDSVCIGWFVIWFTSVRESCLFTLCFTVLGYSCQTFKVLLLLWRQLQEVCNTAYMNTLFYVYPHRAVFWWRGQRGKSILVGGCHFRSVASSGRWQRSHGGEASWASNISLLLEQSTELWKFWFHHQVANALCSKNVFCLFW